MWVSEEKASVFLSAGALMCYAGEDPQPKISGEEIQLPVTAVKNHSTSKNKPLFIDDTQASRKPRRTGTWLWCVRGRMGFWQDWMKSDRLFHTESDWKIFLKRLGRSQTLAAVSVISFHSLKKKKKKPTVRSFTATFSPRRFPGRSDRWIRVRTPPFISKTHKTRSFIHH